MKAFIINFNQLASTKKMYEDFERYGVEPIVVDNNSTYKPLLDWYDTGIRVIRLDGNYGHNVCWDQGIVANNVSNDYYIVTDPDLDISNLPLDWKEKFISLYERHRTTKVGPALRLDDVPDTDFGKLFKGWEAKFWTHVLEPDVYFAPIDTAFALYHTSRNPNMISAIRVGGDYQVRHLPSYHTPDNITYETAYYIQTAIKGVSTSARYSEELLKSYMGKYNVEVLGPIDVVIPTRGRPHRIKEAYDQLGDDPRLRLIFVCGDEESVDAVNALVPCKADFIFVRDVSEFKTAVTGTNTGFQAATSEWVVISQDDIKYHENWIDNAVAKIQPGIEIVGFHDGDAPHASYRHSVTWFVHKPYFGDWVFHPGYKKNFADNDLNERTIAANVFVFADDAVTEHLHWSYGKTHKDGMYSVGEEHIDSDRILFQQRQAEWLR